MKSSVYKRQICGTNSFQSDLISYFARKCKQTGSLYHMLMYRKQNVGGRRGEWRPCGTFGPEAQPGPQIRQEALRN